MIKSVEKAMNILAYMIDADTTKPISLSTIANACGLNQSTCAHIVDTLCASAFMERISRRDGYILGPMGYRISTRQYYRQELIESALPVMRQLTCKAGETSTLTTYIDHRIFVPLTVYHDESGRRIEKIQSGDLYRSASGRIILAYLPPHQLDKLITTVGYPTPEVWDIPSSREALNRELAAIRARGVAAFARVKENLSAVAAPVLAHDSLQGAVGVFMPHERFEGEHLAQCIPQTVRAARLISQRLEKKLAISASPIYGSGRAVAD